jgi:hypothetical protein
MLHNQARSSGVAVRVMDKRNSLRTALVFAVGVR